MAEQPVMERSRKGGRGGTFFILGLLVLVWFVALSGTFVKSQVPPSPTPAITTLDPNAAIPKKEFAFRYLPRTRFEWEKLAAGTGQFNKPASVGTEKFTWVMEVNGDGDVRFSLSESLPPEVLGYLDELAQTSTRWHAINNFTLTDVTIPAYLSARNDWLWHGLSGEISVKKLVHGYLVQTRGYSLYMEATDYAALPEVSAPPKNITEDKGAITPGF